MPAGQNGCTFTMEWRSKRQAATATSSGGAEAMKMLFSVEGLNTKFRNAGVLSDQTSTQSGWLSNVGAARNVGICRRPRHRFRWDEWTPARTMHSTDTVKLVKTPSLCTCRMTEALTVSGMKVAKAMRRECESLDSKATRCSVSSLRLVVSFP